MFILAVLIVCLTLGQVAQSQCRQRWTLFGQSCYRFADSAVTFAAAEEICKFYSAKLAEPQSLDENNFLKSLARNTTARNVWIGGTDIFGEGNWMWLSTGTGMLTFLDWAQGQPDDSGGEDCVTLYKEVNYQWNDYRCDATASFICQGVPSTL